MGCISARGKDGAARFRPREGGAEKSAHSGRAFQHSKSGERHNKDRAHRVN